ncbi:alpha-1-acid glycoprotein 1 [Suricata suricatta]|uniref:Lipocalin/cytosolic fatty-acid binding domain-containing protein n=1 Tax=Suricata suricatta TaxID=37032 RepID=A0A673UK67_SURSU|nr:alpha-1-acid glycoprotein 1 [Suricata suricatta]
MALSRALAVLSLLPLLAAQSPECGNLNLTATPITNTTLDQLSGKWFYIASAFRNPEFNQSARTIQAAFFYFHINSTEDTILLREYLTIGNQCVYNVSSLDVHRENGSLSKHEFGKEQFGYFLQTKDPKTFMLAFSPKDEQNMGLSFYTDKAQATQEQMREFHEAITCMGMQKSEIVYTDEKQNACGPLEKQHKEEKEKQKESEGSSDDTALG